jgi:hypothetical protein
MTVRTENTIRRWTCALALALAAAVCVAPRASAQTLTNADIVRMVQAKLGDDVIISEIKHSTCSFDTSPTALIKLKEAGVSDTVLEAMTEAARGGGRPAVAASSESALPSAFGFYIVDRGVLRGLELVNVTTRMGLIAGAAIGGTNGYAVDGLVGNPPISVHDRAPIIIAYGQNIDVNTLRLSELTYVSTMKAYQFNILGTQPAFFRNVYGRGYNDTVQVGLWRPDGQVSISVEPVDGKPGMYRLIPNSALGPGRYSLYEAGALHGANMIFASPSGRQSQAFYFGIGSPSSGQPAGSAPASPNSSASPPAPVADSCTDYNSCLRAGFSAENASDWQASIDDFHTAASKSPTSPLPWALVGGTYLQTGQIEKFSQSWDKVLKLGGSVGFDAWHQLAFSTERGGFQVSASLVSFTDQKGKTVFAAPPAEVKVIGAYRIESQAYLHLRIAGRNYNIVPVPFKVACQVQLTVQCPTQGVTEQQRLTRYIAQAIPRLAAGTLGPRQSPPAPAGRPH